MIKKTFFVSLLCIYFTVISLQASAKEKLKPWSGSAEMGLIFTSGNTETTSAKGRIDVKQVLTKWVNDYQFDLLFKEDEVVDDVSGEKKTEKTAEKYFLSAKGNYKLKDEFSQLFLFGSHSDDKFAGVKKYTTFAIGYGRRLLETETSYLDADIGPGYVWSEQADGKEKEGPILRLSADYHWTINENAKFYQRLSTEIGEDNTRSKSETGLLAKINHSLQMKLGVVVINNSEVPVGTEYTDVESTVTLVYSF